MKLLDSVRNIVKRFMEKVATILNTLSGGRLSPNMVTVTGFLMHIPIALLICRQQFIVAGVLLIIFGLFDTLDGSLARLQKRASTSGMFLDSMTDRVKEVFLYGGIIAAIGLDAPKITLVATVLALGISICISYANAWGEVALHQSGIKHQTNKTLRGGIMGFEVRMFTLVIGLLASRLDVAVMIITILGGLTLADRIRQIMKQL